MSLRFVLGRSGSGKSTFLLKEVMKKLKEDPKGPPIIYLVPDQMTFQVEYQFINNPYLQGMIRCQVFSFTRLAWRVLQETGGFSRYHLNSLGLHMLLRKILEYRKDELKIYTRAAEKTGFLQHVEDIIAEFKRYCITPEDLYHKGVQLLNDETKQTAQQMIANKLFDFHLIYQDYEKQLLSHYVDSEDYLRLLSEKVSLSNELKTADIYIDGFHSFTPQELEVLYRLMDHCRKVTVALTLDPNARTLIKNDISLFQMTNKTYFQLKQYAKEEGIVVEDEIIFDQSKRFQHSPSLTHLEKFFDERPTVPYLKEDVAIQVIASTNRRAEVEHVARNIIQLVRQKQYRWRDFAVLVRDQQSYNDLLKTIFEDYHIPVFIDMKRSMLNHPLIELVRSSLDVIHERWRYEPIFRCVKTDFFCPFEENREQFRERMDVLENYILAHGIHGTQWKDKKPWEYRRYQAIEGQCIPKTDEEKAFEEEINELRTIICKPLSKLEKNIHTAHTAREFCTALFSFLEDLEIPKKVDRLCIEAEEQGNLRESREHSQVWQAILDLLDQMVNLMEEETLSFSLFRKMILSGLENMYFATVPPAIDQVFVGNMERSRFTNIKCTFILGANDGVIPLRPVEEGVFTEEEREWLLNSQFPIAPGNKQKLLDEQFLMYLALTSCSDLLTISYPLADAEGKSLVPSILIHRIKELFPAIQEKFILNEPNEEPVQQQLHYITNPKKTMSYLSLQLQNFKRGYPIENIWWDVYNWLVEKEEWEVYGKRILGSLFYSNRAKQLSKKISQKLYGKDMKASVSRMELFQSCPFAQFISYGLRLKKRPIYRLEAPDIGQLFHAALKMISEMIQNQGMHWANLSKKQCEQFAFQAVESLAPTIQKEILLSSHRFHYLKRKLQQVVGRASLVLRDHAKVSGFEPIGLEIGFGPKQPLSPLHFQLKNGCTMEVIGRIDRVDQAVSQQGILLRIIDYKSSQTSLDLLEVYYGLALQMLTYLDVVVSNSKQWLGTSASPAGVLYFHVHNPMLQQAKVPTFEQIEKEIYKQFKMKGLVVADHDIIHQMDQSLKSGQSDVIPVGIKKDGEFYSSSSIVNAQDFNLLRSFVREKIQEIGTAITNGVIDIEPYKLKQRTACKMCSYQSICQFDESQAENHYKILTPSKKDEVLDKIRKKGGQSDE